jgi:hypothetical protein
MGFYEIGGGCDSCSEVSSYGNNGVLNQTNNVAATNAMLATLQGANQPNNRNPTAQQIAAQVATQPAIQHYQPPEKKAIQAMNKKMVGNTTQNGPQLNLNIPSSMFLLNLGMVILAALAINECARYYINKTIQLDDGNPLYFVGYATIAVLFAVCIYMYCQRNC